MFRKSWLRSWHIQSFSIFSWKSCARCLMRTMWKKMTTLSDLTSLWSTCNGKFVHSEFIKLHLHLFRLESVILLLLRALQSPNWLAQCHCAVRVDANKKLVGFIAAVPADIRIYETWVSDKYKQTHVFMWNLVLAFRALGKITVTIFLQMSQSKCSSVFFFREKRMVQVKFLCVHKKLRLKRMTPVLIRELTRRVNQQGVYQAVYTAGIVLPTPLSSCR